MAKNPLSFPSDTLYQMDLVTCKENHLIWGWYELDRNSSCSFQFPDSIYRLAQHSIQSFIWKTENKQKNWKSTFTCWFVHSSMSKANSISINDSEHISHVCYINIGWYCHMQTVVQTMPTQLHKCFGVWKRMLWCSARRWKSHVIYFPHPTIPILSIYLCVSLQVQSLKDAFFKIGWLCVQD